MQHFTGEIIRSETSSQPTSQATVFGHQNTPQCVYERLGHGVTSARRDLVLAGEQYSSTDFAPGASSNVTGCGKSEGGDPPTAKFCNALNSFASRARSPVEVSSSARATEPDESIQSRSKDL
jgi:hypothetical protein